MTCRLGKTVSIVLVHTLIMSASSMARSWPRAAGETNSPICKDAYRLAEAAFRSDNAWLFWPFDMPKGVTSSIDLQRRRRDISDGNGLTSETNHFRSILVADPDGRRNLDIYWESQPKDDRRLAVVDQRFNWEGDWYYVYVLRGGVTSVDLAKDLSGTDTSKQSYFPVLAASWNPPLVLTENTSGSVWFIDMGAPYQILGDWKVYTMSKDGARNSCTMSFRPDVRSTLSLLPKAAQRLAALLDSTLGSGKDEGTLQPTSRIRLDVAEQWANLALRPWALEDPYDTRKDVDEGLRQWSLATSERASTYHEIRRQLVLTGEALGPYYEERFKLSSSVARQVALYATDLAYRSYFIFPHAGRSEDHETAGSPWPARLR